MTRDEIVAALRCCGNIECMKCRLPMSGFDTGTCRQMYVAAADLIENQQRHIEALMKANDSLKDAVVRRDKQIEDMKQGMVTGRDMDVQLLTPKVDVGVIAPEDKAEPGVFIAHGETEDGMTILTPVEEKAEPKGWKDA